MARTMSVVLVVGIVALSGGAAWAVLETANPDLPPTDGEYVAPSGYTQEFDGGDLNIVLQDIVAWALATPPPVRANVGPDEQEEFEAMLTATANVTYLTVPSGPQAISLSGPAKWMAENKAGNMTGTFNVEFIEMSLAGDVIVPGLGSATIMLRESPTKQSMGQTTIDDLGGGLYHIDSFFDVFAEVSPDGGDSWIAASESVHIELIPEPVTLGLLLVSGLAMLRRRRK